MHTNATGPVDYCYVQRSLLSTMRFVLNYSYTPACMLRWERPRRWGVHSGLSNVAPNVTSCEHPRKAFILAFNPGQLSDQEAGPGG